ncbi:hypothetical protein IL306_009015 [Fusarium sp. DS 682]|nr:hypothetical protein IL306_009015 [Fusarium sp. DS 682]
MPQTTELTLFKETSYQVTACIGKVIGMIGDLQFGRPESPSQEKIDEILSHLKTLRIHLKTMNDIANSDEPNGVNALAAVLVQAEDVLLTVDNIQYSIWRQHPDRPCKDVLGRVRESIFEHPIDRLD